MGERWKFWRKLKEEKLEEQIREKHTRSIMEQHRQELARQALEKKLPKRKPPEQPWWEREAELIEEGGLAAKEEDKGQKVEQNNRAEGDEE